MKVETILLLAIFAWSSRSAIAQICCFGENEVYSDCGPSCYGDGCSPFVYKKRCDQGCQAGCFCKCGFFRNSSGQCVPAPECDGGVVTNVEYPKVCPGVQCCRANEYWGDSNKCLDQCRYPGGPQLLCIQTTFKDCWCLPGYKRNKVNVCVPVQDPSCAGFPLDRCLRSDPNSEVGCRRCGSCTQQIELQNGGEPKCPFGLCKPDSCRCVEGYFHDDITDSGLCVPYDRCLELEQELEVNTYPPCPANQTYAGCGSCESCYVGRQRALGSKVKCPLFCKGSEFCKCDTENGFWSIAPGQCVHLNDCPAPEPLTSTSDPFTCPKDEEPGCSPCFSCERALSGTLKEPCPFLCQRGSCKCKKGLYRSSKTGQCLGVQQCQEEETTIPTPTDPVCGENEDPFGCESPCQTCYCVTELTKGRRLPCALICSRKKCVCKPNFYRSGEVCKSADQCLSDAGIQSDIRPSGNECASPEIVVDS